MQNLKNLIFGITDLSPNHKNSINIQIQNKQILKNNSSVFGDLIEETGQEIVDIK